MPPGLGACWGGSPCSCTSPGHPPGCWSGWGLLPPAPSCCRGPPWQCGSCWWLGPGSLWSSGWDNCHTWEGKVMLRPENTSHVLCQTWKQLVTRWIWACHCPSSPTGPRRAQPRHWESLHGSWSEQSGPGLPWCAQGLSSYSPKLETEICQSFSLQLFQYLPVINCSNHIMTNGLASCVPDILRGVALDGDVEVQYLPDTWHVSWSRDSPPWPWPRVASSHLHPLAPTISRKSQQPALVLDLEKGNEVIQ